MILDKLPYLVAACTIAGGTSLAIITVPLYWHSERAEKPSHTLSWLWPEQALVPPTDTGPRRVKTETYTALTIVPKTPEPPTAGRGEGTPVRETMAPKEPRDICQRDGGYRITVHHGRGWRCVYPHRNRHRRRS